MDSAAIQNYYTRQSYKEGKLAIEHQHSEDNTKLEDMDSTLRSNENKDALFRSSEVKPLDGQFGCFSCSLKM